MKRAYTLILLALLCTTAVAQRSVYGNVSDPQGKPVADVIVKFVNGAKTSHYEFTDAKGNYRISLAVDVKFEQPAVVFSFIGYKTQEVTVYADSLHKPLNVVLVPTVQQLREVRVKANPLTLVGDTLRYSLAPFLGKGDVTLEDGLKRLPGIEVSKSGAISYMGQGISNFYIEGLDMLGGRYNLATRNIPAEYTSSVEILRRHHDRKIDKDEDSDKVALNIKLKKKAKFRPFGQSQVGAGWQEDEPLYAVGLTGMMFTDDFQTICSGKYSNNGDFASYDMTDHFGGGGFNTRAMSLLGRIDGGAPPKGDYLYQTNGMASLNAIVKFDSLRTVKANINYSYEDRSHSHSTTSTYFAGGENITLSESVSPDSRLHKPSLGATYTYNGSGKYITNYFDFKARFEENDVPVLRTMGGTSEQIGQHRCASGFDVRNMFITSVRIGKNKFHFNSINQFTRTPGVDMIFSVLDGQGGLSTISQWGQSTSFHTREHTDFKLKLSDKTSINIPFTFSATYDFIETERTPDLSVNEVNGWKISPSVSPSFEWRLFDNRMWIHLSGQIRWLSMMYKSVSDGRTSLHDMYIEPSLSMKYTFSPTSELRLTSNVSNSVDDIMSLLTNEVQTGYRSTRAASGVFAKSQSWSTSVSHKYEIPFSYFSVSSSASWSQGKRNVLNSQFVDGGDISNSSVFGDSHSRNANFRLALYKNLLSLNTKLKAEGSYSWSSNELMEQGERITTYGNGYGLSGNASVTPIKWLELSYDINFSKSFTRYSGRRNTNESLSHKGRVAIYPIDDLQISASYDYVRQQITTDRFKDFTLFDASAQYKIKRSILKLSLLNFLDTRHYSWTVFDGVNRFTHDYNLCGRTVMLTLTYHK